MLVREETDEGEEGTSYIYMGIQGMKSLVKENKGSHIGSRSNPAFSQAIERLPLFQATGRSRSLLVASADPRASSVFLPPVIGVQA